MTTNRYSAVRDTTANQRPVGEGSCVQFMCSRCGTPKSCAGRRLMRVGPYKRWVCKACAAAKQAAA